MVQPNGTSWHKIEYVQQVVQGEAGLHICVEHVEQGEAGLQIVVEQVEQGQGSLHLNLSTVRKWVHKGRVIFSRPDIFTSGSRKTFLQHTKFYESCSTSSAKVSRPCIYEYIYTGALKFESLS